MTITYDKTVLLKRGNTAVSATYTGPLGEVTVDTDLDTLRVHDGVTPGGHILANVSQINSNINLSAVNANVAAANLTIALTNANIGAFQTYANIEFTDLWANAAAQTIALDNFIAGTGFATSANLGAYQIYANANIGAYQNFANITFAELSANLGNIIVGTGFVTQTQLINNVNIISANIGSFQTFSNANAAIQSQALFQANINHAANVIAANASISALQTNAAIQQTQINALDANIGSLITGTGFASLDQLNANVGILNTKLRVNVEIISANLGAYQTFANANSIAQSNSIDTLLANAGTQATSINLLNANIGAYQVFANANVVAIQANLGSYQTFANANITTIQANLGAYQTYANANVVAIQANLGSYQVYANANAASQALALDNLTGNAATQGSLINTINANVAAANAAVTTLTANAATQSTQITLLNANVTAANVLIASLQSNAAVQANILDVLSGNAVTQQSELAALVANAAAQGSELTVLIANASAQAGNLTTLISNAATQATAIDSITANIGAYQTYANANAAVQAATLTTLVANAAAQALEIDSLTGNAATQGSLINTLDSNLGSATTSITTLQSNAATQAVAISSINANTGAYQTYANANAAVQAASITTLVANAAAQALDIDSLTANAATQGAAINTLNANIGAYQTFANSNAATQATAIDSITANIGAYQTYANANAAVQATGINTINANVGAYQTYANANVVVIQANLGAFQTYANAQFGPAGYSNTNVAAYLNNENITSANIGAYQTYANATFGTSNYGNANVATYLSAFNGNIIPSANVTYSLGSSTRQWKDLWVSNNTIYIGNTPVRVDGGTLLVNGAPVGGSYGNANVAEYLPTYSGNVRAEYVIMSFGGLITTGASPAPIISGFRSISTAGNAPNEGNITASGNLVASRGAYITGNVTAGNINASQFNFANGVSILAGITGTYSNANVASYLPTYSGAISANIAKNGYTWRFGTNGTTQFPGSQILAPAGESITMQSDQYSQLMWENANLTVAPNMAINSNFYVAQNSATLDIGYRDGSSTQLIKSWLWSVDGSLTLPGEIILPNGAVIRDTAGDAVVFGQSAGQNSQGTGAVAIGLYAGSISQGAEAVAIGDDAGKTDQGVAAVAVGYGAGYTEQGIDAVAVGDAAGYTTQGNNAIAIGASAGTNTQGANAVAIGFGAGQTNQGNNSIIINATGGALNQITANTLTVAPVRNDVSTANVAQVMFYNTTSKEITYGNTISIAGNVTTQYVKVSGGIVSTGASPAPIISGFSSVSAENFRFQGNGASILSNVVTKVSDSWIVTTGTNTYSFTVPSSGTYQLWVDCNIPNGILAWNATATVTNSNVPVVGAQYAWVYNGGGTPIDFVSIPNQFTGTANTIVRSNTAPSATTNRFDFGINNTSGGNVTVTYGYIKI